jgi:hypothetical protein
MPVPGVPRLNKADDAWLQSISCPTAGNCAAGGFYSPGENSFGHPAIEAFVVSQVHGIWGKALEVPGTGALNTGKFAAVGVVSCAAPGKCSAAGSLDNNGFKTFVVTKS